METMKLGKSDIDITPILMGTWQAGKTMWTGIEDRETEKAIRAAFDAGITTFDTATVYGDGHSERILGKALSDVRDRVVIATKVFAHSLHYDGVIAACNQSLADLRTDYIDLYQIHWPAGSFGSKKVPIEETMRALNDLRDQGKIRAVGVSNFSGKQVAEAAGFGRIDSLQPPYSLFWRQAESDGIPFCRENEITVLAYSPMAQGFLTGKFGPGHRFDRGDHRAKNRLFGPDLFPKVTEAVEALRPIAEKHDATLAQLALAWVISHPNTGAIAGARNEEQVRANAGAAAIRLTEEDLAEMDRIGRTVTDRLDNNPVMWKF